MINCSLGNDGAHLYEDTCSFTCNTGYELTGSDSRTCQSNGSWSGTNSVCKKGLNAILLVVLVEFHTDRNNLKFLRALVNYCGY